jgi:hypothetical protein
LTRQCPEHQQRRDHREDGDERQTHYVAAYGAIWHVGVVCRRASTATEEGQGGSPSERLK